MAAKRLILTAACLALALAFLGVPAFADDEVPTPPPAPAPAVEVPPPPADEMPPPPAVEVPPPPADEMPPPPADEMPPPPAAETPPPPADETPSPVIVDETPPAWRGSVVVPTPPVAGTCGTVDYMMIRDVCCDRRDRCGWRLDARGCRYGRFDLTLEGLWSIPDQPQGLMGVPVAYVAPGPALPAQFDWDGVDYDTAFGGRVGLAFQAGPFSRFEIRATYYGNFTGSDTQTGAFGFRPGVGGAGGVSAVNTATLDMEADLCSAELNFWEEVSCTGHSRFDVGGGIRAWCYEETAEATSWASSVIPGAGPPSLSSKAHSRFIGVQVGGVWHYDFSPCLEFRAIGKVLAGNVNQQNDVQDANILGGGPHTSSVENDEIRLGADVDLGFLWRLHRRIGITFGYNLLVLDGVSRANEIMDFTASTSGAVQARVHDGQVVNHAFFLGVNFNF